MKIEKEDCTLHGLHYKSINMESYNKRKRETQQDYEYHYFFNGFFFKPNFLRNKLNKFQFINEVFLFIKQERMDRNIENAIFTYLKERCWLQQLLLLLKKNTEHEKKRRWKMYEQPFYGNLGEAYFHIFKVFELEERDIWNSYLKELKSMQAMDNDREKARLSTFLLEEIKEHGDYLTQVTFDVSVFLWRFIK